ncbi:MAG: hypothetical protein J6D29_03195 [Solobacterium sp.]|nr:hypothetical protein [Solobacterium sp.]
MYKKNDLVVYRRDVCKVVDKVKSDMTGEQCYILQPYNQMDGSVRMQVPVSNKGGHLRDVLTREEVSNLIKNVPNIELLEDKPANMKSQYVALLKEDKLEDLIRIIKTSYQRKKVRADSHKKLAAIDGEYLEKAERYLFTELAVAMEMNYEECKDYFIKQILKSKKKTVKK